MSKKDVDQYFNKICNDYHELIETIHDMQEEANKGLLDPDKVDQVKQTLEPMKVNWQRISYIMYLLNKPNKKKKWNRYELQNQKFIHKNSTLDDVHTENEKILNDIKAVIRTS